MLLQRNAQAVPVMGAAQEHSVLARIQETVEQRKRRTDPPGATQRGQAAPAQPQAEKVGEALSGVQPQVQADAQVTGAVAGQVPDRQERPSAEHASDERDDREDGELDHVWQDGEERQDAVTTRWDHERTCLDVPVGFSRPLPSCGFRGGADRRRGLTCRVQPLTCSEPFKRARCGVPELGHQS